MKKQLIQDDLFNINIILDNINDAKSIDEITTFEAYAQEADKKNLNDRIYPTKALKNALDKIQHLIAEKKIFAYKNHPNFLAGEDLENIAAYITEAKLVDGVVRIKGKFTSLDAAKTVKTLLKDGVKVGLSARGYGLFTYDEKQKAYIAPDDYEVDGWDFVTRPAVKKAKVTSFENENINNNKEEFLMEIKTLDELKVAHTGLCTQLIAQTEAPLKAQVDNINKDLVAAKAANDELKAKLKAAEDEKVLALKANDELKAEIKKAQDAAEKVKFDAEVAKMLADNKYKDLIEIPASITTVADAKAFIEKATAKYDAFTAKLAPATTPANGVTTDAVVLGTPKGAAVTDGQQTAKPTIMDEYIAMAQKK